MKKILLLVMASFVNSAIYADVTIKSCEDWDKDGRFGIVAHTLATPPLKPYVIKGNVGTYASCLSEKSKIHQCKGKSTLCTCEDWDKDGRFGIVKNLNEKISTVVVKGNTGNYYQCVSKKRKYKNTSTKYYACEDWDKDGRFGIVQYNLRDKLPKPTVIKSNYGNYYKCTEHKSSIGVCKAPSLCTCEDWNKDGRFGIVKYKGVKKQTKVLQSNIGTYASCLSKIR